MGSNKTGSFKRSLNLQSRTRQKLKARSLSKHSVVCFCVDRSRILRTIRISKNFQEDRVTAIFAAALPELSCLVAVSAAGVYNDQTAELMIDEDPVIVNLFHTDSDTA